jgi:iron complex outermembrane receptor protein
VDAYQVSTLRAGGTFRAGAVTVEPYVGINNLFDEDYFQNVRLNQGFARFFEPAPGRNVYGGVTLRVDLGS